MILLIMLSWNQLQIEFNWLGWLNFSWPIFIWAAFAMAGLYFAYRHCRKDGQIKLSM